MIKKQDKNKNRIVRHKRVRKKIAGTSSRPRLCVYKSTKHIYAQLIDDTTGTTLASAGSLDAEVKSNIDDKNKKDVAYLVGEVLGKRAVATDIKSVVFDRGGYLYHGRVAKLADGARSAGLEF